MLKPVKYGKIAIVIFLTCLIWIWADLATDEDFTIYSASIHVAKSVNPNYWASFESGKSSVAINKVVFRGPASKVTKVSRALEDGSLKFDFFWKPDIQKDTSMPYPLDVLDFLKNDPVVRKSGLTIRSCEPQNINVKIVKLIKKTLTVKCRDQEGVLVEEAVINPARIDMLVPDLWGREKLTAWVQLTESEMSQAAMASAVHKNPFVELSDDQIRSAASAVAVSLPAEERLTDYTITNVRLGVCLSDNLQGKYKVEVTNLEAAVMAPITIRATSEAKGVYQRQPFQMILYILDDYEKDAGKELFARVVYNFPEQFVQRGEIKLKQEPVEARFKLIPIPVAVPDSP